MLLLGLPACSGSSSPPPTGSEAPALRPSGSTARSVDYRCIRGRQGTITVAVPDLRKLADVLNPINVCEFDGGLAQVTLTVACSNGSAARVSLRAVDGKLPTTASAAC